MVKAVRHEDHEARHHRIAKAATGLAGLADQHADESNARPQESKSNMIDVALDGTTLQRWRASPISFVEEVLHDPETGKPFVLLRAEVAFMQHAFALDDDGRLTYPEQCYGAPKKSGKTSLAAMIVLVMVLLRNDARFGEGLLAANDFDQAASRVFMVIRRIVAVSPLLKGEARITADKIVFPAFDATITAIASDAASAAGGNPVISCFDELWGYTSERATRLWDELITSPARKISCRLTVSYAGFSGESVLLEELHKRGMALPEIGPHLRAGDGMLFAWHTEPVAPWQDERWLAEMRRSLRPSAYARMIMNEFVSPESKFVDLAAWDTCVQPSLVPVVKDRSLRSGLASMPRPSGTAPHWWPAPLIARPPAFGWLRTRCSRRRRAIRSISRAPSRRRCASGKRGFGSGRYCSIRTRWRRCRSGWRGSGCPSRNIRRRLPNLTACTSNLFDLLSARQLVLYPDAGMRLAISHAIITESSRGWKLDKLKQAHKIDVVVALSMAALAAVRDGGKSRYDSSLRWVCDDDEIIAT